MSREKVAALEQLQTIDLKIEELRRQGTEKGALVTEAEKAVARARTAADAERGRLADNERARRQQETLLTAEKDKVKKWEARLPSLKHPREFAALQREVEGAKRANLAAEEEIARLKTEAEPVKTALRTLEADLSSREAELASARAAHQQLDSELAGQIAELQEQRQKAATSADPKLLSTYESLRKRRPGRALVPATNLTCTGCNRRLAPQLAYRLIAGAVEVCPSCSRLVYTPEEHARQGA